MDISSYVIPILLATLSGNYAVRFHQAILEKLLPRLAFRVTGLWSKRNLLCPGAVATNLYNLSDNLKTLAIRLGIMMRPEKLAKKGINALFHHRASLLPGLFNKICTPLVMLLPHGLVRWIMRTTKLVKLDR